MYEKREGSGMSLDKLLSQAGFSEEEIESSIAGEELPYRSPEQAAAEAEQAAEGLSKLPGIPSFLNPRMGAFRQSQARKKAAAAAGMGQPEDSSGPGFKVTVHVSPDGDVVPAETDAAQPPVRPSADPDAPVTFFPQGSAAATDGGFIAVQSPLFPVPEPEELSAPVIEGAISPSTPALSEGQGGAQGSDALDGAGAGALGIAAIAASQGSLGASLPTPDAPSVPLGATLGSPSAVPDPFAPSSMPLDSGALGAGGFPAANPSPIGLGVQPMAGAGLGAADLTQAIPPIPSGAGGAGIAGGSSFGSSMLAGPPSPSPTSWPYGPVPLGA